MPVEVSGIVLLALLLAAGLASFAVAALVGGIVAAVVDRRGRSGVMAWAFVGTVGMAVGPFVLVALITLGDVLDGVPLLHPAWALTALAGAACRIVVVPHLAPSVQPRR